MSETPHMPKPTGSRPRILVIGVGGAGGNAINNMIAKGLTGAHFAVANTDAQALSVSSAEIRIQLGVRLTEGLGAGAKPEIGEAAAEEALEDIRAQLTGAHMVFIAAGMGGGTGTGAASVIARVAKELGILTVAVVTKPFHFEGSRRMRIAEIGVAELKRHVDTLLVIPNQNLFNVTSDRTTFAEAFLMADEVLHSGVSCIVDLIVKDGLINLDLADVKTVLSGMGSAMMGTAEASGEQRAVVAAEMAIVNPLLDGVQMRGARSVLLSITGSKGDLTLWEVDKAAQRVREEIDPEATFIFGATFDETLSNKVRVSIVASGIERPTKATSGAPVWASRGQRVEKAGGVDDYQRRLSQVISGFFGGDGDRPPANGRHRAHGEVFIEERPPHLLGNGRGVEPGNDEFDGGRESGEAADPHWNTAPPAVYQRQPESPARPGLLRRLAGLGAGRNQDGSVDPRRRGRRAKSAADRREEEPDLPPFLFGEKK